MNSQPPPFNRPSSEDSAEPVPAWFADDGNPRSAMAATASPWSWVPRLGMLLVLTLTLLWSISHLIGGVLNERGLTASESRQRDGEPGLRVLLRQRERNQDTHPQITIFVAQNAILSNPEASPPQWISVPSGSSLHILPNVESGFLITSRALPSDLSWSGRRIRLIPDRHNQRGALEAASSEPLAQEEIFRLLDSLPVEAADNRPVFGIGGRQYRGSLNLYWHSARSLVAINQIGIESYLEGVLQSELSVTWPLETLKAQAVASRSYAYTKIATGGSRLGTVPFHLRDTVADQEYRGTGAGGMKIDWAITSTRGEVLHSGNSPFAPFFHAASGGHLAAVDSVFPGSRSANGRHQLSQVMVAKADPFFATGLNALNKRESHGRRTITLSSGDLRNMLRERGEQAGWPMRVVAERLASGHITQVHIGWAGGEVSMSGAAFRQLVGPNRLRSTLWTPDSPHRNDDGNFIFTSTGWGHGVGMSQLSAYAMAHHYGYDYRSILDFFYEQSRIERLW
ncbi:MAG: SpoIID/LytB domain-containing protein [Planctomycetota bacterium]|nr:MAG: SpoIID/LytB domain-containing protein [Planctomycetota bacterium]